MAEGELADKNGECETVSNETNTIPTLVTEDMAAAAGFNVKSPIVNAVIKNLTEETERENSQEKRCPHCNVACMTSDSDRVSHILGKKHRNKMWSLRIIKNLHHLCKKNKVVKLDKGEYMCQLCKVTVNSPLQLVSHMRSVKHISTNTKTGIVLSANPMDDLSSQILTYFCHHCRIHLNSKKQMLKHRASFIHLVSVERNKSEN